MAKYIDNNGFAHFLGKLKTLLDGKVNTETGKGLSTNDYTTAEKNKLAGIESGAQVNAVTGIKGNSESSYRTGQVNITAANVGAAASSHEHGNIQNGGTLQTTDVEIANGDKLVITDSSDSNKIARASIAFDGSTETKCLSQKGTWVDVNNYSLPTASADTKGGVKIGAGLTMTGEVLSADVQSVPVMTGATSSADGTAGLVPAPESGPMVLTQYLRADGSWFTPPNNNDRVSILYAPTTKASLLATTYIPVDVSDTTVGPAVTDPDVYLDTTAGKLTATSFSGSGAELTNLNGSNISSGTVAAARLPDASSSAKGAMSAAHYSKLEALPTNATLQSTYALKSDITSMYKHKGSVSSTSNLPSSGQTEGDVYNVTATGMNYVWTGSEWDALGEIFTIDSMTTTEIDAAFVTAGLAAA